MKCMLRNQCVDAARRGIFTTGSATVQWSITTTVPNFLKKSWITDSLLINEGGIRVLCLRRQIAVLSNRHTTINLSFKPSWFGFRSNMPCNQRSLRSKQSSLLLLRTNHPGIVLACSRSFLSLNSNMTKKTKKKPFSFAVDVYLWKADCLNW